MANNTVNGAFTTFQGQAYFTASDDLNLDSTVWTTDGTPAGTRPIDPPVSASGDLLSANGVLYFIGGGAHFELYETDGTTTGLVDPTQVAGGWKASSLLGISANGLVFSAFDSQNVAGLWSVPTQGTWPPMPIPPPPQPPASALVPSLGRVTLKGRVVAGTPLNAKVPVRVTNDGNAFNGDVTVKLYANTGTTLDGNEVLLATESRRVALKSNQRAAFAFGIKALPQDLPSGTYHLIAQVIDPARSENAVATEQTVQAAAQSGRITASVGPFVSQTLAPGASGSVIVTVTNETNFPSRPGHIWVSLVHSSTPFVTDSNGVNVGDTFTSVPIPIGKSRRFRFHFTLPATVVPGTYYFSAFVTLSGAQTNVTSASPLTVT